MAEEGKENCRQVDTSDGRQVAAILFDFYLNSFSSNHNAFMERFSAEPMEVQHNFMALASQWFLEMSEWEPWHYDERNEKSVIMAKLIRRNLLANPLKPKRVKKKNEEAVMEVCYYDNSSVASMLSHYLRNAGGNDRAFDAFMKKAVNEHKTLQQNFTRFIREWCSSWLEKNPNSKQAMAKTVNAVVQGSISLPYI